MNGIPITPTPMDIERIMLALPQELGLTEEAEDEFGPPMWVREYTLMMTISQLNLLHEIGLMVPTEMIESIHWLAECSFLLGVVAEREGWDTSILVKGNEGS